MRIRVNTVDGSRKQGLYGVARSIARDSKGRRWIAYHQNDDVSGSGLYVAYSDDGIAWTEELAVDDEDFDGSSPGISLLIDSQDVPHILYVSDTVSDGRIYHTSRAGGVWPGAAGGKAACTIVFTNSAGGARHLYGMAACIDRQNNIHLVASDSWAGTGRHGTFYFKYTASTETWGSEVTLGLATFNKQICQIVVDSGDNPHVLLTGTAMYGLRMFHYDGANWGSVESVLSGTYVAQGEADLAIDSGNNLHIAYIDSTGERDIIKYAKGVESSWGTPVVIAIAVETYTVGDFWFCPAIVLDSSGNAYVIYQNDCQSVTIDDGVYYVKVINGSAGDQQTLVSSNDITYPGTAGVYQTPSIIAGLWQKYPSKSVLPAPVCPTAVLFDVNGEDGAKVMYCSPSISLKGNPNVDQLMYQHVERME